MQKNTRTKKNLTHVWILYVFFKIKQNKICNAAIVILNNKEKQKSIYKLWFHFKILIFRI